MGGAEIISPYGLSYFTMGIQSLTELEISIEFSGIFWNDLCRKALRKCLEFHGGT